MSIELSIDALTAQTSSLLDVCVNLKTNAAQLITDAVAVSQNAALIPLMSMSGNLIDTQTLLVSYITQKAAP